MFKDQRLTVGFLSLLIASGAIALILFYYSKAFSQVYPEGHHLSGQQIDEPRMPGQDAFGAIQEVVEILEADPTTDWSRVDLMALREHLIDMNQVTLSARVNERKISSGLEIVATVKDRTMEAIQRMIPAQAKELNQMNRWRAGVVVLPDGVRLTVTSAELHQIKRIQSLGFMGLLVSGKRYQKHHLAIARGMTVHE